MTMKAPRSKTYDQVRAIFGSAKESGIADEALRDVVADVTKRTRSIKELTFAEAERVITRLKGDAHTPNTARRTQQHRRRKAGVKQMVQQSQLELIAELASQRNWTAETITNFCQKMIKRPRPLTTNDANKMIEALKAMNKREGLWSAA
jgi:hypothetical protein